jgi:hypothetical protein
MKRTKIIMLVVSLLLITVFLFTACTDIRLTKKNFDKINTGTINLSTFKYEGGMKLSKVKLMLGKPTHTASTTFGGKSASACTWGDSDKNIIVTFIDDMAVSKISKGL